MLAEGRLVAESTRGDTLSPGVEAGSEAMSNPIIYIGERDIWGQKTLFGISAADHHHHIYIIGKTGSGKTTLLRNMLIQHIAFGHGVALIDPHGDLAEELLNHIPAWRADDLILFDPGDAEHPIGFNPLANVPPDDRHLVASGIVGAFKSIWRDSWGARLEYILYNAVAALLDCTNVSLLGVNRLLIDAEYRAWVVRQIRDPFVREFWLSEYENYDDRFQREAIAPIQNKAGQFLLSPLIRNILGQVKNKVSIALAMNHGQVFIANLAKGRLGDDKTNLIGSLLVTQFQLAAMQRVTCPVEERVPFYLFIDQFQTFSTDSFVSILAEARKYGLCLILSHQYIDQVPLPVRQAVFGNVGTLISFRVGHTDAEVLQSAFGDEFVAEQFVDLNPHHILVSALEDGITRVPFRATSLPPVENWSGRREQLTARSRERFTTPRREIEEKIRRWLLFDQKGALLLGGA
jgi:hypothetical protein